MPFGDVSGRVGHILGPSVEFAFGQPLLGQLYELVLRSCSVLHTKHSKISCSTILMQFVRGVPLSTSLPLRAQRTAIKSSTLPTCLHCALHRAKYELCDGMMLRRSSSVPLQLSRSHPTARRRATGTPRSSRERSAPAPAGPTSSLELRAARGRLAEDSAFILTNRSHPTALRRASVTERALYFTAAVQAVGASERDGAGAAGVAGRVHGFGATGGDTDLYGRLRVSIVGR